MRKETIEAAHLAPLLFRHAIPRTSSAELPGYYDNTKQLWVVETKGGIVAVVEAAATTIIQTNTSTRVHKEGNDKDCSNTVELATIAFAETTLTAVQMEVDDQDASTEFRSFEALLDTHTLTKVRQEADDSDITADETFVTRRHLGTLAELSTKTDIQQESDDQVSADEMLEFEAGKFNNNGVIDNPFPSILHELQNKAYGDVEGSGDNLSMIH